MTAPTLSPGTFVGRYEVLQLVRSGRLSEVYRARDNSIGRLVAVKMLPGSLASEPGWLGRFEREARAAGQLDHPNILSIHDVGVHDGRPYLVSEWLEGETLRERLADGALPWRKAVAYAIPIATGIAAAHERGIVHRDLKPENVFLTRDGRIKILDFGLARAIPVHVTGPADAESPTIATVTEPGVILGTVGYMSPEQVRGRPADVRSDIFGLGAVFYEAVSGRPAFQASSSIETMIAILQEDPPPIPATKGPASLERIIRRCLEKSPQQRFQSAHDLVYALEDLLAGATEEKKLLEARERPSGNRSRATGGAGKRSASGSAEDSGFCLIVRNREVPLRKGETLLGRGRGVTIRLHQKGVSRRHARIWIRDGEATIEDLKSKNGTYLRGERIVSPARLEDGDEIRLGSVVTVLRITPATGSTATENPG